MVRVLRPGRPTTDFELGLDWSATPEYADWALDHALDPALVYGLSIDLRKQEVQVYQWEPGEYGGIAVQQTADGPRLKPMRPYKIRMLYPPANLMLQALRQRRTSVNPLVADRED